MHCTGPATCIQQTLFIRCCRTALRAVDWLFRANWQFRPIVRNSCTRARPRNECWHDCCMLLQKCTSGTSFRLIRQFWNSFEIVVQELARARNFAKAIKKFGILFFPPFYFKLKLHDSSYIRFCMSDKIFKIFNFLRRIRSLFIASIPEIETIVFDQSFRIVRQVLISECRSVHRSLTTCTRLR